MLQYLVQANNVSSQRVVAPRAEAPARPSTKTALWAGLLVGGGGGSAGASDARRGQRSRVTHFCCCACGVAPCALEPRRRLPGVRRGAAAER